MFSQSAAVEEKKGQDEASDSKTGADVSDSAKVRALASLQWSDPRRGTL